MIWGSSIGWLALYAGVTHNNWKVVGVELLPGPVQIAQQVAQKAGLSGNRHQQGCQRTVCTTRFNAKQPE